MGEKSVRIVIYLIFAITFSLFATGGYIEYSRLHETRENYGKTVTSIPATVSVDLGSWSGELPKKRRTEVVSEIRAGSEWAGSAATDYEGEQTGGYRWAAGDIAVTDLQDTDTLAHEYGHALTVDVVARDETNGDYGRAVEICTKNVAEFTQDSKLSAAPDCLREVAEEYQSISRTIFDRQGYYTSNLSEYLAMSFAYYSLGHQDQVQPVTRAWLEKVEAE